MKFTVDRDSQQAFFYSRDSRIVVTLQLPWQESTKELHAFYEWKWFGVDRSVDAWRTWRVFLGPIVISKFWTEWV